ncbi:hypothetical protein F5X96DRAFT_621549 [Biscogniauxia mediterranea]|nr:hypothetical protein F5X96DRAFT_621549 [Biscogniauxia mediterranea]
MRNKGTPEENKEAHNHIPLPFKVIVSCFNIIEYDARINYLLNSRHTLQALIRRYGTASGTRSWGALSGTISYNYLRRLDWAEKKSIPMGLITVGLSIVLLARLGVTLKHFRCVRIKPVRTNLDVAGGGGWHPGWRGRMLPAIISRVMPGVDNVNRYISSFRASHPLTTAVTECILQSSLPAWCLV